MAEGPDFPVSNVTWHDCQEFCNNTGLLLPTEAQWEMACRAGLGTPYSGHWDDMGWTSKNSEGRQRPVGGKKPNGFGIYDMHGNVWEWCVDTYDERFYLRTPGIVQKNPECTIDSEYRVTRGGGTLRNSSLCRSAARSSELPGIGQPDVGFRPAYYPLP